MVQLLRLISRRIDSVPGSRQVMPARLYSVILRCFDSSLPKPSRSARACMMTWSGCDSNSGSITFSRHCSERLDAVHEPEVSNCVAAGSR